VKQQLLVATRNLGKVEEFSSLLHNLSIEWLTLDDINSVLHVEETGDTFSENAIIKARAFARESGMLTIADDSGLEVDALDGEPGVRTARYGGPGLSPKQRYELLLKTLGAVPWDKRGARFRCVIAVAMPKHLVGISSGTCEGMIANGPKGSRGFGYDPVFFLPYRGLTMAQLDPAEKHQISHRGKAIAGILPVLREALISDD